MEDKIINPELWPYVLFLPAQHKNKALAAVFGSQTTVDILKFALNQGITEKIYQQQLITVLPYSNKTIIRSLQSLTEISVLDEAMEKKSIEQRTFWVKTYCLTQIGQWFALLLADENDLTDQEKTDIFQNVYRLYLKWVNNVAHSLNIPSQTLQQIFDEEMEWNSTHK